MARSFKRYPYYGEPKNRQNKRNANKRVRQRLKNFIDLPQRNQYKQLFESYDICDYGIYTTWHEYWHHIVSCWYRYGYKHYPFPDRDEEYWEWYKRYKRK